MEKAREVIRLHEEVGLAQREIADSVNLSVGTVSGILAKARAAGIGYPITLNNKELGSILYPPATVEGELAHTEPDMEYVHSQMQRRGVTLTLLWEEYKTMFPDGLMFTQFCARYRQFRKANDVYMRRIYKAGERVMVDWAGDTMTYHDDKGTAQPAYLFVATLPASSYMYVEAFRDMGSSAWIDAHAHAFEFFGGVPRIIVPDNAKTAVTKADSHDPEFNRSYAEMARHYGIAVVPARVKKPRDKAPVETGVQIVERRIIAKLRDREFFGFDELWEAVREEMVALNQKPFQKLPGSRLSVFEQTEKPELRALPRTRYESAQWKQARAGMDYHVQFEDHYYSVPYRYAGKQLDIRATASVVEIFCEHERIASHIRGMTSRVRYVTDPEHMPSAHRAVSEWSPERFMSWAGKFGPDTQSYIQFLLNGRDHPEQAYKTCAGILNMGRGVPQTVMEDVCREAQAKNVFTYKYFSMLFRSMTSQKPTTVSRPIKHDNLRGNTYYGGEEHA